MKNGLVKKYYDNGKIYSECYYINNKLNGLSKLYYNKRLTIICYYNDIRLNSFKYNKNNKNNNKFILNI